MGTASFKNLTTLKIGGRIKHFFEVNSDDDVISAVSFAKNNNLPIFIIGEGSDILVNDNDFDGVVIKHIGNKISYIGNHVIAQAGVIWDDLVEEVVEKKLQGIENLSAIPGTVGAAPIQNIGAYGSELKDVFVCLKAYDIQKQKFVTFNLDDCKFGYRDSIFKSPNYWQKYLICEITLKLNPDGIPKAQYESLKKHLLDKTSLTIADVRKAVVKTRQEKLEDYKTLPNAGSFFKNPIVNLKTKKDLEAKYPEIKIFSFGNNFKVSAGYLIEKVGLKGFVLGNVKVSDKHALIITNPEAKATYEEVKTLADKIIDSVYNKFQIKLEPEVQYINI